MNHDRNIQGWLTELGNARRDGAFTGSGARYPWQTVQTAATGRTPRRLAWIRVAVPLAAAAVVAFVFVVPSFLDASHQTGPVKFAKSTEGSEGVRLAAATPKTSSRDDCDFNGDGVVDGRDIQAFVQMRLHNGVDGDRLQTERLQHCLLGI